MEPQSPISNIKPPGQDKPSGPGQKQPQQQGGPQPAERLGGGAYKNESDITRPDTKSPQTNPDEAGQAKPGKGLKEKAGKAAASASETAKDVQSVAKAGSKQGLGVKEEAEDVKKAYQEKGAKGAAGEVGRKAVGKGVQAGLTATGVGAPVAAVGGKAVEKALKKGNLKKILIGIAAVLATPFAIAAIILFIVLYAAANPAKFLEQVLTDPKAREFATQAADLAPSTFTSQGEVLKKYGYSEDKGPNTAFAANGEAPKPGSLAEKFTNIDIAKAVNQTESAKKDCYYHFTTKQMVNAQGKTISVIDKVYDRQGKEVTARGSIVYYCIMQSFPIFQMMIRTPLAREVNAFGNVHLNYAAPKDSEEVKAVPSKLRKYVYDKTYNFITNKPDQVPKLDVVSVTDYIAKVREALVNDKNPYAVDSNFQFPATVNSEDSQIIDTMCTFSKGYLLPDNLRKGITSRFNTGQRSSVKWTTLSSTREKGDVANSELSATLNQVENWQASRAYAQNLYARQTGEAVNPESLSNTSYSAGFQKALALFSAIKAECEKGDNKSIIQQVFGGGGVNIEKFKALYIALKTLIVEESNGKFTSINQFGLQQLMIGVIRLGGGSAVSGVEPGPQNFNNQSQGIRELINQYMMRIGGRFLTTEEQAQLATQTENNRRELEQKNGLAYRLFDKDNIRSLANIVKFETPRSVNEAKRVGNNYIATLSNPIKALADFNFSFGYYALGKNNQAFAASALGDAYMRLDTVGLPKSMFKDVDIFKNSDEIQEMLKNGTDAQKKVLGYFDKCARSNLPSTAYFARLASVDNKGNVNLGEQFLVKPNNSSNFFPYYAAFADQIEGGGDLKEEKRAFMACEIYLLPPIPESNPITDNSQELFGLTNLRELATKYHLYLYSNSMADLLVKLSNQEKDDSIYANPGGGSGSGGDRTALGEVECPTNMGAPDPSRHNYIALPPNPDAYTSYVPQSEQLGVKEMLCVIYTVGKEYHAKYPNSKLRVGEINSPGHSTHNWGIAVDLDAGGEIVAASGDLPKYNTEATIELGKLFVDTGLIENIWWCEPGSIPGGTSGSDGSMNAIREYAKSIGKPINIKCIKGHYNHFHVDLNCALSGDADIPWVSGDGVGKEPEPGPKPCSTSIEDFLAGSK